VDDLEIPLLEEPGRRPSLGDVWAFAGGPYRHHVVARVADRIFTRGAGRFFVSGYSGVGKSLFLRQVVDEVQFRLAADRKQDRVVFRVDLTGYNLDDVQLIGRQLTLQLNWEVERMGLKLGRIARQRLHRAVEGVTTKSVERLQARREELKPQIEVSGPIAKLGLGGAVEERSEQRAVFEGFDVPTTLLELGTMIRDIPRSLTREGGGFWRFLGLAGPLPKPLIVVTVDRIANWEVIPRLADLFSTPDAAFLVVIPLEVRAQWLAGRDRGKEDIPGFQDVYVPCIWEDVETLVMTLLDVNSLPPEHRGLPARLAAFLAFMSNGIPRRIEDLLFNHLESAPDHRYLRFSTRDLADIEFCAGLYDVIRRRERDIVGDLVEAVAIANRDQFRRIAIDTARQFASQGVIRLHDYSHTMMLALEAIPEDERERIVRRVLQVLQEEGVAAPTADGAMLSAAAREKAARGHTVLLRAYLPPADQPTGLMAGAGAGTAPVAPPTPQPGAPPPEGSPSDPGRVFSEQVMGLLREDTAGHYEILHEIGRGGMSVVFLARDLRLNRQVAIKVLPPSLTMDAQMMARFRHEAQTAAQLSHPAIVPIYAISGDGPLVWYSMMYVDGPTLQMRIEQDAPLSAAPVADLLEPVAAALDYAHRSGVIHRDIKPDNILRGPLGGYMLLDFGIAKALATPAALTGTGMAIGTPRYMSPEQLMAREVSAATDQYALATVAFELLTGRAPFESDNVHGIMMEKLGGPPPPATRFNPAVPAGAGRALARALSPEPEARFGTVGEFVTALRAE
jgi:hypothetical protein